MTEKNKQLLDYIIKGYSVEEIKAEMNLTSKQFLLRIRQLAKDGYSFNRIFDIDGKCVYQLNNKLKRGKHYGDGIKINSTRNNNQFLIISDTHFGSDKENINYIQEIYKYAKKHDIHTIFHVGDFIHGIYNGRGKLLSDDLLKYNTIEKQLKQAIKLYPFDPTILNYVLFGNHDLYSVHFAGIDIASVLENSRTDIISLGYGDSFVSIRKINFYLVHRLVVESNSKVRTDGIIFYGHYHRSCMNITTDLSKILIPSLSDIFLDDEEMAFPGALHVAFEKENCQNKLAIKNLILVPEVKVVNKTVLDDILQQPKNLLKK